MENEETKNGVKTDGTQPSNSKKSNTKLIVIVVVVLVALSAIGYLAQNYLAKKAAEKTAEVIVGGITGAEVGINDDGATIETDSGSVTSGTAAQWPSDMPAEVPEFKYGTIIYTTSSKDESRGWSVMINEIDSDAYTKYRNDLIEKGWTETATSSYTAASVSSMEKDNMELNFATDSEQNTATLVVTYIN